MYIAVSITHRVAAEHMKDAIREVEQERLIRTARPDHGGRSWRVLASGMLKSLLVILHGLQSN